MKALLTLAQLLRLSLAAEDPHGIDAALRERKRIRALGYKRPVKRAGA